MDRVVIEGLEITCVIGAWEWERHITQKLVVDLAMGTDIAAAAASDALSDAVNYAAVAERVEAFVVETEAVLIERLAEGIAQLVLAEFGVSRVSVRVAKPGAVRAASTVAIEIERQAG
ncbi:MAG: dihydroneopterin aldolase [Pseudomonadota bacterium]